MPSVSLISLGCAKNLVNSEQMLALLVSDGFEIEDDASKADIAVINTCGFIDAAKKEAISEIQDCAALKKSGNLGALIVAGCMAERYKIDILSEFPEVDAVIGVGSSGKIAEVCKSILEGSAERGLLLEDAPESFNEELPRVVTSPKAWAYIKIAEGCDNRCAYCVIPSIRGRYRSRSVESILSEAENLVSAGARELILIAQDSTRYGTDLYGERKLSYLVSRLSQIENLQWIRLHYLYPDEIDEELLREFEGNPKLLKYLDIPIQHIDEGILKAMNRRGSAESIRELISRIRKIPGAVIRTSLIAGLPGETDEAFQLLCDFLRDSGIERAGVFAYSPEDGTPAALMPRPDAETADKRRKQLEDIAAGNAEKFDESRRGKSVSLLLEEKVGKNEYIGRSYAESPDVDGYITVSAKGLKVGSLYDIIL